jgi:glucose dehydrogenase
VLTLAGITGFALLACQGQSLDTSRPDSARAVGGTVAADPATMQQDDGQWVMPAKNYAAPRFSGLDEINAQNVGRLGVSWTFSTGMVAGHEAAVDPHASRHVSTCDRRASVSRHGCGRVDGRTSPIPMPYLGDYGVVP